MVDEKPLCLHSYQAGLLCDAKARTIFYRYVVIGKMNQGGRRHYYTTRSDTAAAAIISVRTATAAGY